MKCMSLKESSKHLSCFASHKPTLQARKLRHRDVKLYARAGTLGPSTLGFLTSLSPFSEKLEEV